MGSGRSKARLAGMTNFVTWVDMISSGRAWVVNFMAHTVLHRAWVRLAWHDMVHGSSEDTNCNTPFLKYVLKYVFLFSDRILLIFLHIYFVL